MKWSNVRMVLWVGFVTSMLFVTLTGCGQPEVQVAAPHSSAEGLDGEIYTTLVGAGIFEACRVGFAEGVSELRPMLSPAQQQALDRLLPDAAIESAMLALDRLAQHYASLPNGLARCIAVIEDEGTLAENEAYVDIIMQASYEVGERLGIKLALVNI